MNRPAIAGAAAGARQRRPEFVIWSPRFRADSGGILVLHLLCERLNEAGIAAALWPRMRPFRPLLSPRGVWDRIRSVLRRPPFHIDTGPFRIPIARKADVPGAIVVYPEIVSGNPLDAARIVRWFLHRPGNRTGLVDYGDDELYFFFLEAFDDPAINADSDNRLTMQWINPVYSMRGEERSGSCYMMKKGKGRAIVHDLENSICLDGLSHEEIADAFNRTRIFYCYDIYTMYAQYAAICGCIPVLVPEPGLGVEEWVPRVEDRYGLAYGEENIPWAVETRGALLDKLAARRAEEDEMLMRFVAKCREFFGKGPVPEASRHGG